MEESSSQDIGIAIEEISNGIENANNLKSQIDDLKKTALKVVEELNALTKIRKRVRTASYIELGVGVPTLILGCLPIWTDEQKNIQNLLLGIGGSLTATGGAGIILTFTF